MLKVLTNDFAIGLGFLFPHIYFLFRGVLEFCGSIQRVEFPCGTKYSTQKHFLLFVDVPNALFVAMIAFCYLGVILRIIRNRRQVNVNGNLTDLQVQQKTKATLRMRNSMITLGCIIIVTTVSILPRTLYGLYANIANTINEEIVKATNNLLLLNPLVDPFIYIFSIEEVRHQLICKCRQTNRTALTAIAKQPTSATVSGSMS